MIKSSGSNYRWYILALSALTHALSVAVPWMCMPVLFDEIAEDLGLSLVQIGTLWGTISLAAMFVCLVGGLLGDRFGVKRTLVVACFLVGLAGALRGLSNSFATLAVTMFLFGLVVVVIPVNVHKACGVWFSSKQLGLANGIVAMGMAVGFMAGSMLSATVLSPLLGGWSNVLFLYGGISVVVGILWLLTRSRPSQADSVESSASHTSTVGFRQALSHVMRIKGVWLLGLISLGQAGCVQGVLGYLPLYLRDVGWAAASADGALTAFHGASMVGVIPITLLSDKLGSRKMILFIALVVTAVGAGLLSVAGGAMVWVLVIMVVSFVTVWWPSC